LQHKQNPKYSKEWHVSGTDLGSDAIFSLIDIAVSTPFLKHTFNYTLHVLEEVHSDVKYGTMWGIIYIIRTNFG
jgi:hypothetical protein